MAGAHHESSAKVKGRSGVINIPMDSRQRLGVTQLEAFALQCLAKMTDPKAKDLELATQRSKAEISRLSDNLNRKGLITKHRTLDDLRTYIMRLTPKGEKIVRSL